MTHWFCRGGGKTQALWEVQIGRGMNHFLSFRTACGDICVMKMTWYGSPKLLQNLHFTDCWVCHPVSDGSDHNLIPIPSWPYWRVDQKGISWSVGDGPAPATLTNICQHPRVSSSPPELSMQTEHTASTGVTHITLLWYDIWFKEASATCWAKNKDILCVWPRSLCILLASMKQWQTTLRASMSGKISDPPQSLNRARRCLSG